MKWRKRRLKSKIKVSGIERKNKEKNWKEEIKKKKKKIERKKKEDDWKKEKEEDWKKK